MNNKPDDLLFREMQQDNEAAFEVLMHRYSSRLYRLIYKHTHSSHETKDMLQEIFIGVWKHRRRIVVTQSLYPYLYRAAKNAVIDHVLDARKQVSVGEEHFELLPAELAGAEEYLYLRELETQLQESIQHMPETMKAVLLLSREEQLSSREIAARLNISEQTVRNNISLALQRIRKKLGLPVLLLLLPSPMIFDFLVTLS